MTTAVPADDAGHRRSVPSAVASGLRLLVAAALRALPLLFGDRGRRHANWRAHHWVPQWLNEGATDLTARRGGVTWRLDLRDNVQKSLYYLGGYEPLVRTLLVGAIPDNGVFIDIGAHIGAHAVPVARHLARTGGRVVAFEPAPDNQQKLRTTAARAGLSNLTVVGLALGSGDGRFDLRADRDYGDHDTGVRSRFGDGPVAYEVSVTSFDRWLDGNPVERIDAVKIDVEGAELDVLAGMESALRRYRPRVIVVELLEVNCAAAGVDPREITAFLGALGYVQLPDPVEKNAVFVPAERLS